MKSIAMYELVKERNAKPKLFLKAFDPQSQWPIDVF